MAKYNITQDDIYLLKCSKLIHVRVFLLNNGLQIIDELDGYVTSGDGSDDATSDVRKSCNFTLHSYDSSYNIGEYNRIWLNNRVRIDLGFEDMMGEIHWYTKGTYVFDSCSYAYDGSTRDITFQCSDLVTLLDGTHSGIIIGHCPLCNKPMHYWGGDKTSERDAKYCTEHRDQWFGDSLLIEGCKKIKPDDDKDNRYEGNDIKKTVEDLLEQYGILNHKVDTIGQVSCLQGYAVDWKRNRIETGTLSEDADEDENNGTDKLSRDTGTWHMIPYDLEFDRGTTLWEVLTKIRDLYPGYEMFFDKDGMFHFQLIPICHHDSNVLDHTHFDGIVLSENTDYDLTTVRNATKVYGQSIETDRFSNESTFDDKATYIEEIKTKDKNGKDVIEEVSHTVTSIKPKFETTFVYKGDIVVGVVLPPKLGEYLTTFKEADRDLNGKVMGDAAKTAETKLNQDAYLTISTIVDEKNVDLTYPLTQREAKVISYKYFSKTKSYKKGDCCLNPNETTKYVYRFLKNKSAGDWDVTYVEKLSKVNGESDASNIIEYPLMKYKDFNETDMFCFKFLNNSKKWVYAGMYQIEGYHENNTPDSPFAIDKIGYRLQILSGGDYDDIPTSKLAKERAEYETWLKSRLTDSITIETVIIPFLEVNQKIEYKKLSDGSIDSYIIKSLSYSYTDGTMTITMSKFYELDPSIVCS